MKKTIRLAIIPLVILTISLSCGILSTPVPPTTSPTSIINDIVQVKSLNDFFGGNLTYTYPFTVNIPIGFVSVGSPSSDLVIWLSDAEAKQYVANGQMPEMGNFFLAATATNTSYDKHSDSFLNLPNNEADIPAFESSSNTDVISVEKRTSKGFPLLFIEMVTPESLGIKNSPYVYFIYIATPQISDVVLRVAYFSSQNEEEGRRIWTVFKSSFNNE
jgi:hypothetical protein